MTKFDRSVSLVSWAYNEEELILSFLTQAAALLEAHVDDYEIVLIDDGSTDRTLEIAQSYQQQNPNLKIFQNERNLNVGISSQRAIQRASKEFLFWQTVDWSYDISNIRVFLEFLRKYDVVQGVRSMPVKMTGQVPRFVTAVLGTFDLTKRSDSVGKAVVSLVNYLLIRILFRVPISDYQNVSFYQTEWIQGIKKQANSSFANPELVFKAYWSGKTIKEVPISFIRRLQGEAKGTKAGSILMSLKDIFRLWLKWVVLGQRGKITKGEVIRLVPGEWQ